MRRVDRGLWIINSSVRIPGYPEPKVPKATLSATSTLFCAVGLGSLPLLVIGRLFPCMFVQVGCLNRAPVQPLKTSRGRLLIPLTRPSPSPIRGRGSTLNSCAAHHFSRGELELTIRGALRGEYNLASLPKHTQICESGISPETDDRHVVTPNVLFKKQRRRVMSRSECSNNTTHCLTNLNSYPRERVSKNGQPA